MSPDICVTKLECGVRGGCNTNAEKTGYEVAVTLMLKNRVRGSCNTNAEIPGTG